LLIIFLLCCSALAMATESEPLSPRALFNHGAELAASGKLDEAVEVLRQAAVVRDRTVAAKALVLLGQIAIAVSKQCLAETPEETPQEQRQKVLDHLKSAEQSFTESLALQSNEDVRQYLETLRAWRHNMTNAWEQYDREQLRNTELQQRIRHLADWEEKLAGKVCPLLEEQNSPRKCQAAYEAGKEQKRLADELAILQKTPISDDELKEKWERLPEIQKIADEAGRLLIKHRTAEALPQQQQVLDYLRSLLKQEPNQNQQNQEQNEQESQDQNQQSQQQESSANEEPKESGQQESEMNQPQAGQQKETAPKEESPEEKAERLLMQVRRKEQAAKERREQFRALLMQAEPVEKNW
jgi:hypothetical protein